MITTDPSTWPKASLDRPIVKIWTICHAIAIAEGYNQQNSNPFRLNNPGDISDGYMIYGGEAHSGSSVTHFPNAETGWQWLYDKLNRIAQGKSAVYSSQMTWVKFSQKWSGDWQNWVTNVTKELGVDSSSTFQQFLEEA
jgi:hypothetical protein